MKVVLDGLNFMIILFRLGFIIKLIFGGVLLNIIDWVVGVLMIVWFILFFLDFVW